MQTLAEILPEVPSRTRQRWAQTLADAGLITPSMSNAGTGNEYETPAADTLREFARLVRVEGLTVAAAIAAMTATTPRHDRHVAATTPATAALEPARDATAPEAGEALPPGEVVALRAALEAARAEAEEWRAAEERARREAEDRIRAVELARLEAERRALEAAREAEAAKREAREAENAAAIANQSANAATAKLIGARRRADELGFLARVRAAFAFVFRRERGALLLLPESLSASEERRKAA